MTYRHGMTYRRGMPYRLDKTCLDTDRPDATDHGHGGIFRHHDRIYYRSPLDGSGSRDDDQIGIWSLVGGGNGTTARTRGHCAAGYLDYQRGSSPTRRTQTNAFVETLVGPRE
jgi:hypothetical protein